MTDGEPPAYAPEGEVEFMPDWHKLDHAARIKLVKAAAKADQTKSSPSDPHPPTEGR